MCMHACVHACACMYAYIHTDIQITGFFPPKPSLSNFVFFRDNNKIWDLSRECERQITCFILIKVYLMMNFCSVSKSKWLVCFVISYFTIVRYVTQLAKRSVVDDVSRLGYGTEKQYTIGVTLETCVQLWHCTPTYC